MKKNKVWLGQIKDVSKITKPMLDQVVSKFDKYKEDHPEQNIAGYVINGGRDSEGITKAAKNRLDELNEKGHHNIIFTSDRDTEIQIQNLKNRNTNNNKNKS